MSRGDFEDLPGQGKPLNLDDDAMVPEELRTAYRMLKNAGFVPPEVAKLREAAGLRAALAAACDELNTSATASEAPDEDQTRRRQRRLVAITMALDAQGIDLSTIAGGTYYQQTINKLAGNV